jgi:hypothetical protein
MVYNNYLNRLSRIGIEQGIFKGRTLLKYREMYEPYVNALAEQLLMELPSWIPRDGAQDDWMMGAEE